MANYVCVCNINLLNKWYIKAYLLDVAQRGILPENLAKINGSVLWVNGWNFLIVLMIIMILVQIDQ